MGISITSDKFNLDSISILWIFGSLISQNVQSVGEDDMFSKVQNQQLFADLKLLKVMPINIKIQNRYKQQSRIMLNKNVADYTDFSGKTNKKIVQAPGGNSSIAFFWGDIKPETSPHDDRPTLHKHKQPVNQYQQIYSKVNNREGGSYGYGIKSKEMILMDDYQKPQIARLQQNQQISSSQHYANVYTPVKIVEQNKSSLQSGHKAGNYMEYRNNKSQITQLPVVTKANQYNKSLLLQQQNQSIYSPEYKRPMIKSERQNPKVQIHENYLLGKHIGANKQQETVSHHEELYQKSVEKNKPTPNQEKRKNNQQNTASKILNPETRFPQQRISKKKSQYSQYPRQQLDQIDITLKQQNTRKQIPNIHRHHSHQRNMAVRTNPSKKRQVKPNKEEEVESKPCIRMTATPPRNHIIFGDSGYNYWKEKDQEGKHSYKRQQNTEVFGKRVELRNGEKTSGKYKVPSGGQQTFKFSEIF